MSSIDTTAEIPITPATAADRLLVVDADGSTIANLRSTLGKLGFEFFAAASAPEALEHLGSHPFDMIMINLMSKGTDGFDLCKRIQENAAWADIPIMFYSPTNDKDLLVRGLESGGADYLAQPFDKAELLSRIRTHLMLKTTRDHLKHLAIEKEELLGMISHYLQNHLAAMNMSARLLLDRTAQADTKLRLMAENIWNSSHQMRVFIKALLANAAADRGLKISLEAVDFSAAVVRCLHQYEDSAAAKEIKLCKNPMDEGSFILADPAGVDQTLDNLISNAIKFSPPQKHIYVGVQRVPGFVECYIKDEGPGFTEADKARMFYRYARLSARPTAGEPSTGLGLSIAKKLVQAMGGNLACQSTLGEGATFTLRFPASPTHP